MVGFCPNCNVQIMEMAGNVPRYPMGNYRLIRFKLLNGSQMEVPLCMDCFDTFDDSSLDDFRAKVSDYIFKTCPPNWDQNRKEAYTNLFMKNRIMEIVEKVGPLKAKDLENMRVWM